MNNKPLVSIYCITYNHEKFISQAIESFLMQKTNFPVEIVIGEDCSTDNTRAICLEYKEKFPDKIKLLLPEHNLGMTQNAITTLQSCNGKYIALCDGDDYWTDENKLQKQVEFLEANEDFSICFHAVKILINNELIYDYITGEIHDVTDIYDLAVRNHMHTCSVVFRRNEEVLKKISKFDFVIDYLLHMLNAQYGKIRKINDLMGVYRVHSGGVHNGSKLPSDTWNKTLDKLILLFQDNRIIVNLLTEQQQIRELQNELSKLQNSKEMRLGKSLLAPLRFVKNKLK